MIDPIAEAIAEYEHHRECADIMGCRIATNDAAFASSAYECMRVQFRRPILAELIAERERITVLETELKTERTMSSFFKRLAGAFGVDVETFRRDGVDAEEILSLLAYTINVLDKSETKSGARAADAIRFLVKTYGDSDNESHEPESQLAIIRAALKRIAEVAAHTIRSNSDDSPRCHECGQLPQAARIAKDALVAIAQKDAK